MALQVQPQQLDLHNCREEATEVEAKQVLLEMGVRSLRGPSRVIANAEFLSVSG